MIQDLTAHEWASLYISNFRWSQEGPAFSLFIQSTLLYCTHNWAICVAYLPKP
jgi:hypothetical protein